MAPTHPWAASHSLSRAVPYELDIFVLCLDSHSALDSLHRDNARPFRPGSFEQEKKNTYFHSGLLERLFSQSVVNFVKFWTLVPAVRYGSRDSSTPDCSTGYAVIRPRGGGFSTVGIFTKKEKIDYSCKVIKFNFDKTKRVSSTTYWLFWILAV